MKGILLSLVTIAAVSGLVFGVSRAFFSDTETSTGNTFTAGAIDLTVSNESYYNGVKQDNLSWTAEDLTGRLFFNFADLKPGDLGEDTVDLTVTNNPSWVCADIDITANSDVSCTEPELIDDSTCSPSGTLNGELASQLNFIFWADNGNNVLETGEQVLAQGPASTVLGGVTYALADSQTNVWTQSANTPMDPDVTKYIGKAWCFGNLTTDPVAPGTGSPTSNPGVKCAGQSINNAAQTDNLMGDIVFRAVQARHNETFVCIRPNTTPIPTPSPLPVSDSLDIGNITSETGHSLGGWSDAWVNPGWGGNYGGGSSDTSLRLLMGHATGNNCDEADKDATFTMDAGIGLATKLTLEHLDGAVNDSYEVYINGNLAGTYNATSTGGTEVWKTTAFTFSPVTGTVNVRLHATNLVGSWCLDWGQVAFSNALLE